LANITVFPIIMLIAYIALFFYFKGRGGYKSVELGGESGEGAESGSGGSESVEAQSDEGGSS